MLSSNWPDLPTNGSPCASSCSPGASPTTIQWAAVWPVPKTVLVRPWHSLQAVHPATAWRKAGQSMALMLPVSIGRANGKGVDGDGDSGGTGRLGDAAAPVAV